MDFSQYEKRRVESPDDINLAGDSVDDSNFFDDYFEVSKQPLQFHYIIQPISLSLFLCLYVSLYLFFAGRKFWDVRLSSWLGDAR